MQQSHGMAWYQTALWIHLILAGWLSGAVQDDTPTEPDDPIERVESQATLDIPDSDQDLTDLSLEDLMNIEVISVTRGENDTLFRAPAALYVIRDEDIRRNGFLTIPEQLRTVPGLFVGRIDGNKWAISAREQASRFSQHMLVQMDGRTLFTPLFSGVYWEEKDYVLEDIDRIEVVRGPGATLWGSNAINGIINIVSKPARETQGLLFKIGGGTEYSGFSTLRYGGQWDEGAFRLYGKYMETDQTANMNSRYSDDSGLGQGGFRIDWDGQENMRFTLQGDAFRGRFSENWSVPDVLAGTNVIYPIDATNEGWNLLGRLNQTYSDVAQGTLQMYYDYTGTHTPLPGDDLETQVHIVDFDYQFNYMFTEEHKLVAGLGYRHEWDQFQRSSKIYFIDDEMAFDIYTGFVQDTIPLIDKQLYLTLGTKLEYNEYTDLEYQPSARLAWMPDDKQTVWASVSRAVGLPGSIQKYGRVAVQAIMPGVVMRFRGSDDIQYEEVLAWELGYRIMPRQNLTFDFAAFYNQYDRLIAFKEVGFLYYEVTNTKSGDIYGFEASTQWQPTDYWRLASSYSIQDIQYDDPDTGFEDDVPTNQVKMQSWVDITPEVEWNTGLYYYDNIAGLGVPAHTIMNTGVTWHMNPNADLAIWGQNLLDNQHPEFGADPYIGSVNSEIQRGIYASLTLRF